MPGLLHVGCRTCVMCGCVVCYNCSAIVACLGESRLRLRGRGPGRGPPGSSVEQLYLEVI